MTRVQNGVSFTCVWLLQSVWGRPSDPVVTAVVYANSHVLLLLRCKFCVLGFDLSPRWGAFALILFREWLDLCKLPQFHCFVRNFRAVSYWSFQLERSCKNRRQRWRTSSAPINKEKKIPLKIDPQNVKRHEFKYHHIALSAISWGRNALRSASIIKLIYNLKTPAKRFNIERPDFDSQEFQEKYVLFHIRIETSVLCFIFCLMAVEEICETALGKPKRLVQSLCCAIIKLRLHRWWNDLQAVAALQVIKR